VIGRIVIGLAVVAVIVGAVLLGQGPDIAPEEQTAGQTSDMPGYSARNAEVVETGEDGRPVFTVNAALVRQRPNDSRIQLAAPRMSLVTSEGGTWHIQARAGQIHADGSNVDLYGDVKLNGELAGSPAVIGTSIISYDTRSEIARTHAPVTLSTNGGTLGATGLIANLKESSVRLESNVHGIFPRKPK
jgi:lipopolysaccharide export system protein LptC